MERTGRVTGVSIVELCCKQLTDTVKQVAAQVRLHQNVDLRKMERRERSVVGEGDRIALTCNFVTEMWVYLPDCALQDTCPEPGCI